MSKSIGNHNLFLQLNSDCFSWNEWAEKVRQETKQEFIHQFLQQISQSNNNSNYTEGIRHGIEVMDYIYRVQSDAKEYIRYLLQTNKFATSEEDNDQMEEYDLEKLNVEGDSDEDEHSSSTSHSNSDVEYLANEEEEEQEKSKQFIHQFAKQRVHQLVEKQVQSHAQ